MGARGLPLVDPVRLLRGCASSEPGLPQRRRTRGIPAISEVSSELFWPRRATVLAMARTTAAFLYAGLAVACGPSSPTRSFATTPTGESGSTSTPSSGGSSGQAGSGVTGPEQGSGATQPGAGLSLGQGASDDASAPGSDCSDASKLVYVIADETNEMYSFAPDKLLFTKLGVPNCQTNASVNSMAVDRSGNAWINYDDGSIWKVDTTTLNCTATSFMSGQDGFSPNLSMGFSSDAAGSSDETLFVSDNTGDDTTNANGKGAARVDLTTFALTPLGSPYTGSVAGWRCELTGTGDARLFGFFTTTPAYLAEIQKADGTTPQATALPGVDATMGGYAFSFWGGKFWFYTASTSRTSDVTMFDPTTSQTQVMLKNIGFTIVGAGVSTCAPLTYTPPH
jgi:hypothetical protein